ncbi:MAG: DHH family phosphoesterase [Nanoarchaeota archaeon]|nr:DHH family phosphoesterase [Nanoarchaeota archaeon]MBU1974400.1 DHH family phosphoesterase [Nanoarchaeota archaeon]
MLTPKQVKFIQDELASAKNPLFIYDDDPDGLCSFILFYKVHREGKGIIVKSAPNVDLKFMRKVEELNPDKIFVLDVPMMEQDFVDQAKRPVFWIDHHQPQQLKKVHYYNPKIKDPSAYIPTSRMAFQINPQELWIATVGCIADYHMPDFIEQFIEQYPQLLDEKCDLPTALYKKPIGKLVRIFSFLLKGPLYDVRKSVKILTRLKSPDEIMEQKTSQGRYLYKRFEMINQRYEPLLKQAKKHVNRSKILLFPYSESHWSFTADLSNELSCTYPQKVIIIARKKGGEMKCSLRAKVQIDQALEKALVGISGYGGGHPNACGAVIKEEDWKQFLVNFKREL